jgi:hypothetical protein
VPARRRFMAHAFIPAVIAAIAVAAAIAVTSSVAGPAGTAGTSGGAAPMPVLKPQPSRYFHLAYCGSGRKEDPASFLDDLDWTTSARKFGTTILQGSGAEYPAFIRTLVRRSPDHRVVYYVHAHGLFSYDDQAGVLNLIERNFVHATDAASLRAIPVEDGALLVDWEADERARYDDYETISDVRDFEVVGYALYRSAGAGPFQLIWPRAAAPAGATGATEGAIGESTDPSASAELDTTLTAEELLRTEYLDRDVVSGESYRYVVRTIGKASREYPFSGEVTAVAGAPPASPLAHDHQSRIDGAPGDSTYPARFRIRLAAGAARARLLLDRNADQDFEDEAEVIPMVPAGGENWVEAATVLDAAAHTELIGHRAKFGFGYRIEVEGTSGAKTVLPPEGSYTTSVNNRVRDAQWGFYLTRMGSRYWIDHVKSEIEFTGARPNGLVRGVFLDELIFDPTFRVDAVPIDLPPSEVVSGAAALVRALRAARPDLLIYYNGLAAEMGAGYRGSPPDTIAAAGATGGMIEGFGVASWWPGTETRAASFLPESEWRRQIELARAEARRGAELLLLARGVSLADSRARLFAFASYLLVQAPGTQFGFTVDRCTTPPFPEWEVDLGEAEEPIPSVAAPAGSGKGRVAAVGRRFQRGQVWVNPAERKPAVVKLGKPGYRLVLEGEEQGAGKVRFEWVERLELGPQSAAVILDASSPGESGAGAGAANPRPDTPADQEVPDEG